MIERQDKTNQDEDEEDDRHAHQPIWYEPDEEFEWHQNDESVCSRIEQPQIVIEKNLMKLGKGPVEICKVEDHKCW